MTSDAVPSPGPDPVPHTDPPRVDNPPSTAPVRRNRALKTRAGYTWVALVAAAVIGVLLLIFILQNLDQVRIHLFFWQFNMPLGVTLLLSVIAGALVMALAGGWRIMQLRRAAKRR
ncbi:putative integral membrane protein [Nocardia kruczakiae]|uniref:Integral membrane protein n=1 Tax=Nocardia kruczakiae TaxID=261477 RepID=A0ABU1XFM9_9NOCA|nr:lipopolysaccharide assembly protein LapA domain-containing protein [Nocardia kruczakiae]MDR7168782.1 putative integral membrane protein [Nocardia kruczakiae]